MDPSYNNGNLANATRGLKPFSGKDPTLFENWYEKTSIMLSISRPDIHNVMEGQIRPVAGTSEDNAMASLLSTTVATLAQRQAAYDRADHELFAILSLVTEEPASYLVRKHRKGTTGTRGHGQKAWHELHSKYMTATDEAIRCKSAELVATTMKPGQDPDEYFLRASLLRDQVENMGEPITDRKFKDIMVQGLTEEYKDIKLMMYRDPLFTIEQIQSTMRHLYLDNLSRRNTKESRIAGRGAAMIAEPTPDPDQVVCHHCNKPGHYQKGCALFIKNLKKNKKPPFKRGKASPGGAAGKKWCSIHNSTTHNDAGCYQQGAPRPQEGASHIAQVERSDPVNEHPDFNKEFDFDGGFMWMALSDERTFLPNNNEITMLVDSGATEHFVDDQLIPELKEKMLNYTVLSTPKKIRAAGKHILLGTVTGILIGSITDKTGKKHEVGFPSVIVSGLGRHLFSSSDAASRGISTVIEPGNPHLKRNNIVVPLQQLDADVGLCSFQVGLGATHGTPGTLDSAMSLTAQVSADTWHRRLGHMNPRSMDVLRRKDGNGIDYTGTISGCPTCALGKSQQKAHPKKTIHQTKDPMELVYTDLMGPITPAAKGGYLYVAKFTDDFTRMKEIFLLKSKAEAVDSLHLCNNTVAVPLGLRLQRLRADKGGEYTSQGFQKFCVDSGISMEYAATATPQQIGISERDGRTIATIARCLLKDGNFPPTLWGEMFFTAVFISNRSPHAALGGTTPYFKMYNKEADMSILRAIGARAFVHIETHTPKLGDRAWEGKLCGFSHNSRAYRIYNASKGTIVESRNVSFLETPPYIMPTPDYEIDRSEQDAYISDVIDHTSFLHPFIFGNSGDTPDHGTTSVRGQIQDMLRDNAATSEPLEGGQNPSTETTMTGVVPTASPGTTPPSSHELRATRASTRGNPNDEDNTESVLNDRQLRQLKSLAFAVGPPSDFAHNEEQPSSATAFAYATGSPDYTGFSGEDTSMKIWIPTSYKDAISCPQHKDWQNAIQKEMSSLTEHEVYDLVPITSVPKGQKIIGSRFVFKQKADGRFKARLVVQGYAQEAGIDYGKTFAPVCRIGSQRVLLAIACQHDWPVYQVDVQVAFLQSKIQDDVFVKAAPGHDTNDMKTGEPMVMKLKRSLYGLSQSPALWYDTIDVALLGIGFTPTSSDPCVYTHGTDDTFAILTLYVDDILISGNNPGVVKRLKKALMDRFAMTDMGEVSLILGMSVTRNYEKGTLTITQKDYVHNILERYGMLDCNSVHTPGYGPELSEEQPEEKLLGSQGVKLYQAIVGSVLYLAQVTRYDICYAVNQLTRACSKPSTIHMTAAKHLLRYLKGSPDLAIIYKKGQFAMHGYTDASFAANPDNRKSTTGYLFLLGGAPISFGSKTQSLTAQSTVETELMAISYGAKEAVYLSNFMIELTFTSFDSVPINCDSTGALHLAGNSTYSSRTKHIALRYFFLRELVKSGKITIHHVATTAMLADCATKHLAKIQHQEILRQIVEFSR